MFIRFLTLSLLLISIAPKAIFSDPPKKIILEISNDTLKVKAIHKVKNPKKHFIERIKISTNDTILIDTSYTEQTNKAEMIQNFIIPNSFLIDNTLFVEAACNKYGSKIVKLKNK